MKTEHKILVLSLILGLLVWVADCAIGYFFFHEGTLWQVFLLDVEPHEIYIHSFIVVCFFIFGIIVARLFSSRLRTKDRLASTLHSIGDAAISTDTAGIVTFLNPEAQRLTGWTPEAAKGRPLGEIFRLVDEQTGEQKPYPAKRVLRSMEVAGLPHQTTLIAKDGTRQPIDGSMAPIKNQKRDTIGVVVTFRDITAPRKIITALREEKDAVQHYLDIAGIIIVALDAQGKVTLINRKGCEVLRCKEEDIIDTDWFEDFLPVKSRDEARAVFAKLMAGEMEPVEHYENPIVTKTGEERLIAWHNTVVTDREGNIVGTLSSGEDITERQRATAALQESEERFRTVFTAAEDCIFIKDRELKFTHVNPSMEKLLGLFVSQMIGRTEEDVFGIEGGGHVNEVDTRVLAGETIEEEVTQRVNGVLTTFHVIKIPMRHSSGAITGIYGIARNITQRKHSENTLRESEARLQRQNAALAELDMRKILVRGNLPAAVRKITETIAQTLRVERASVWLYSDDRSLIRCIDLYEHSKQQHSDEIELKKESYPTYFAALEKDRVIAAHNAHIDPRTREFSDSYLAPSGISSMLDAPIRMGDRIAGVICCEQVGPSRRWTLDEQNFAASMADSVTLALGTAEQRAAQGIIRMQRDLALHLSTTDDLEQILRHSLSTAISVAQMDSGGISLLDVPTGDLILVTHQGISEQFARSEARVEKDRPMARRVMSGQAIYSHFSELAKIPDQIRGPEGLRAVAVIPIRHDGQVIGTIFLASHEIDEVPLSVHDTVEAIAIQISAPIARSQAQKALQESEEKYRHIVERADVGIVVVQDSIIKFVNQSIADTLGYAPAEMIGTPFVQYLCPDELENARARYDKRMAGEEVPTIYNTTVRHRDGRRIELETNAGVIDYEGAPADFVFTSEITDRTQAQEALRESEEKHKTLYNTCPNGIIIAGLDHKILDANQAVEDMLGYTLEELKGMDYDQFTPEKWRQAEKEAIESFLAEGSGTFEKEYIRKDGTIFPISLIGWLIRDKEGNPARIGVFVEDITKRKQVEEALRKSEEKYRSLVENVPDIIYTIDRDGNFTSINRHGLEVLGYRKDELIGEHFAKVIHPDDMEMSLQSFEKAVAKKEQKPSGLKFRLWTKDGRIIWVSLNSNITFDARGEFLQEQGIARDITEHKRAVESSHKSRKRRTPAARPS